MDCYSHAAVALGKSVLCLVRSDILGKFGPEELNSVCRRLRRLSISGTRRRNPPVSDNPAVQITKVDNLPLCDRKSL